MNHRPIYANTTEWQQKAKAKQHEARRRWGLLRGSKVEQEEAFALIRDDYIKAPSASGVMGFGVALLWLELYAEAFEHFRSRIVSDRRRGDAYYGMAGAAKWCLGEPVAAVSIWHAGLKAPYSRSGLAVRMPLLLFFASVVKPEICGQDKAFKLLQEKVVNSRIDAWPGPIAKLVLNQIGESEFQKSYQDTKSGFSSDRRWLAEFYRNLLGYKQSTPSAFKASMRKLADASQPEWQVGDTFTSRLWHEEFFLARYEGAD